MRFSTLWMYSRLTISFPVLLLKTHHRKCFFPVISGNSTIVMLAHTDHRHKKNLSSTKKINWFGIYHIFCIATNLHVSNCRFQMNESIHLHMSSPDCFQQCSVVYTHTQMLSSSTLKLSSVEEPYKVFPCLQNSFHKYYLYFPDICHKFTWDMAS